MLCPDNKTGLRVVNTYILIFYQGFVHLCISSSFIPKEALSYINHKRRIFAYKQRCVHRLQVLQWGSRKDFHRYCRIIFRRNLKWLISCLLYNISTFQWAIKIATIFIMLPRGEKKRLCKFKTGFTLVTSYQSFAPKNCLSHLHLGRTSHTQAFITHPMSSLSRTRFR
jgi:hypothetical protein